ncbi:MAG TPA: right-handed parallel beta-helix repeat-containing protein [Candidatus Babeliales bacterium]|nr:right-handed parallel beta-helix repeat-containing protein [Candidatus Babeliales bacterium]
MLRLKNILLIYIVHIFFLSKATELTISQPGMYLLGDAITSSPAGADNIINITSSDVVLDLGGYVISQANGTANVAGIVVNPNLSDIVIRNGTIRNVTGTGISLVATDSRIRIANVIFENCATSGLAGDGSLGALSDIELSQCRFYGCSTTGTAIISFRSVNRSSITDCVIDGTVNITSLNCIQLLACSSCRLNAITIQNVSSTGALNGVFVTAGSLYNSYSNSMITNCSGVPFNGFNSADAVSIFNNCSVVGNRCVVISGLQPCFFLTGTNCLVTQCRAIGNSSSTGNFAGFATTNQNNIFLDCVSSGLASSVVVNYSTAGAPQTIIGRCVGSNSAGTSLAIGLSADNIATRCTVFDCLFSRNIGVSGIGVNDVVNTTGSLYYRNVAFNNSTAQFSGTGFPQTVPASPATQFLNAITQPWTNLAVAT